VKAIRAGLTAIRRGRRRSLAQATGEQNTAEENSGNKGTFSETPHVSQVD